ncbi:F-box DNA helicase 1 isoform X2 [Scleropages formosus]|nr:F-box DNA helicase 1 isoform X2 [Scleropages formosus]
MFYDPYPGGAAALELNLSMESSARGRAKRRHLSTRECFSLSQSTAGSRSLTQPFSVPRGNMDPGRGLFPRLSSKRRRGGRTKELDTEATSTKQQKEITAFFPVTSVVRVNPQKEEEEMEEGEDYISDELLQDIPENDCSVKVEPEDTAGVSGYSIWGQPSCLDPAAQHLAQLGHVKLEEEEDVDPLPDAHYGLLGSRHCEAEPSGHVNELPEEVLKVVLACLPAVDLFRSIIRVCRHWRNVVTDPMFVPWKKLYFRYRMKESQAVEEITLILMENSITPQEDLCVLNMVRYMSQFKHSSSVNPEKVLSRARRHRLFVQAEACLKHRIPESEQGLNVWSTLTLMLILAHGVMDILDLVHFLNASQCLPSPYTITEFLSCIATLLLAMSESGISITNRWHYNIFYVLHLIENGSSPEPVFKSCTEGGGTSCGISFRPTHEQQQILSHDILADHIVKIMAFAGTGKTSTLVQYARQRPQQRFLYVAFNRSVAAEAQRTFPRNVDCRTVHSLAYHSIGSRYQKIKKLSTSIHIGVEHVPAEYKNTNGQNTRPNHEEKLIFVGIAQDIWEKMQELRPTRESAHHMTHDGYLKLWQLQKPRLDKYDVIFIDEAQDCSPAIMDIMLSQKCGKVLVGDPHQQIYTFRGAVNALQLVQHTHLYYLTHSFRFGPEIAYVGATILEACKKVRKTLVGGNQEGNVTGENESEHFLTFDPENRSQSRQKKFAILSRCNVTVFDGAVKLTEGEQRPKLHFVGGIDSFGLGTILDLWILMQPEEERNKKNLAIKDSFIKHFCKTKLGGYAALKRYVIESEDRELEVKLAVVEKYNSLIPELVDRIYACSESNPRLADVILGTVHKSKGLEFDTVVVTDDFVKVPCARHNLEQLVRCIRANIPEDEWNLLYVAVTRARRRLVITKSIKNILTLAGEYFLRTELTSSLLTNGQPPQCSVRECQNYVRAESALTMCQLPIRYMDSVEAGGPLCATCTEQRLKHSAFLFEPPEVVRAMPYTEERVELPVNVAMLMALL